MIRRNPCHLSCDIQVAEAVNKSELASFEDALIFNVKDDVGLASKLSGGDYDGDEVVACWDERFMQPLMAPENSLGHDLVDVPEEDLNFQENGEIVNREEARVKVKDITEASSSSSEIRQKRLLACYHDCIRNLHAIQDLSNITNLVQAYQDAKGVDDPTTRQLGLLARKAVDAPKHGGNVRPSKWIVDEQKKLHENKWPNFSKKVRDNISDSASQGKISTYYISQKAMGQLANEMDRDEHWWKALVEKPDNADEKMIEEDDVLLLQTRFPYDQRAQKLLRMKMNRNSKTLILLKRFASC